MCCVGRRSLRVDKDLDAPVPLGLEVGVELRSFLKGAEVSTEVFRAQGAGRVFHEGKKFVGPSTTAACNVFR